MLKDEKPELCIIFANRRDLTRNLCAKTGEKGHKAVLLSGEVSQDKRVKPWKISRNGRATILVATDVAGRGIHIDGVSHVINYTLPAEDPGTMCTALDAQGAQEPKVYRLALFPKMMPLFCLLWKNI